MGERSHGTGAQSTPKTTHHLPSAGGENMLVALIPTTLNNLAGMGLVLLYPGIMYNTHVIVNIEVKQRT